MPKCTSTITYLLWYVNLLPILKIALQTLLCRRPALSERSRAVARHMGVIKQALAVQPAAF
ncbi:MAG: hypothetical protein MI924_23460 [Chloroflexales bacterium]|nr:hypothetical protein [Chloroflexales bacterium]